MQKTTGSMAFQKYRIKKNQEPNILNSYATKSSSRDHGLRGNSRLSRQQSQESVEAKDEIDLSRNELVNQSLLEQLKNIQSKVKLQQELLNNLDKKDPSMQQVHC